LFILIFVVATQELLKKAQPLSKGLHNSKQQLHSTVNTRHAKEELVCVAIEHPRNWKLITCQSSICK
jgi:DNA-binding protein YbaB